METSTIEKTKSDARALYLDLLKKNLTDILNAGTVQLAPYAPNQGVFYKRWGLNWLINVLAKKKIRLVMDAADDSENREVGIGWPLNGLTMIGMKRMNNVQDCCIDAIKNNIPGDFMETGVWKGGTVILMRAILNLMDDTERTVWVADSFQGLPKPNAAKYPDDAGDDLYSIEQLRISEEDVKSNFKKYGLLDNQVKFLKGWFKDTLPVAPIDQLAVLRLDGDMYESTMDALYNLYPKLSSGGYCIIDDYGAIEACKKAVEDYRSAHKITEPIVEVDWSGVYWQKA